MRRFSFSLQFKPFTEERRVRVLSEEVSRKGLDLYFDEGDVRTLCRDHRVSAEDLVSAIKIVASDRGVNKETALIKLRTVLRSHERVMKGTKAGAPSRHDFLNYSLRALNPSHNLQDIFGILRTYLARLQNGNLRIENAMSLLLHGLPGTGKSEFVRYLGHDLHKEILLKRCSDIHSKWVGDTEKNIADAFREANGGDKILFFDEADSFLYPRQEASHSFEISFINEILTQMESFIGIVIFATNHIGGLDHASLRRFKFKIEFRPLTPDGAVKIYRTVLSPLLLEKKDLSTIEEQRLRCMNNLTPGDFSVVRDQFVLTDQGAITHESLIAALINEVRYKQLNKEAIGFRFGA